MYNLSLTMRKHQTFYKIALTTLTSMKATEDGKRLSQVGRDRETQQLNAVSHPGLNMERSEGH